MFVRSFAYFRIHTLNVFTLIRFDSNSMSGSSSACHLFHSFGAVADLHRGEVCWRVRVFIKATNHSHSNTLNVSVAECKAFRTYVQSSCHCVCEHVRWHLEKKTTTLCARQLWPLNHNMNITSARANMPREMYLQAKYFSVRCLFAFWIIITSSGQIFPYFHVSRVAILLLSKCHYVQLSKVPPIILKCWPLFRLVCSLARSFALSPITLSTRCSARELLNNWLTV